MTGRKRTQHHAFLKASSQKRRPLWNSVNSHELLLQRGLLPRVEGFEGAVFLLVVGVLDWESADMLRIVEQSAPSTTMTPSLETEV